MLRAFSGIDRRAALWYYIEPGKLYQRPQIWRRFCRAPPSGDAHSSVYESARSMNALVESMHQKWNCIFDDGSGGPILQVNRNVEVKRNTIATQLDDLAGGIDTFVAELVNNVSRDMIHQTAALTINEILALLMLDLASPTPELWGDKIKKHTLLLILKLADMVIRTGSVEPIVAALHGKLSSMAGIDSPIRPGVIFPLHFTAVECQDLDLRQTAISLLSLKSWREGPWDSATVAQKLEGKSR